MFVLYSSGKAIINSWAFAILAAEIKFSLATFLPKAILFSMVKKGKTATDLSYDLKIPLSSVYKKLSDLEELTLVEVEKIVLSDKGRKFKVYRSRISKADISIRKPEPSLKLVPN